LPHCCKVLVVRHLLRGGGSFIEGVAKLGNGAIIQAGASATAGAEVARLATILDWDPGFGRRSGKLVQDVPIEGKRLGICFCTLAVPVLQSQVCAEVLEGSR